MPTKSFERFLERAHSIADLESAASALQWDQETYMPKRGAESRAEQLATIRTIVHEMKVSAEHGNLLEELRRESQNGALAEWEKAAVRESLRSFERATLLPTDFVRELARTESLAQEAWKNARMESRFELFAGILARLVDLKRQATEFYPAAENRYDWLIDKFEPGMTYGQLRPVFDRLRDGTSRLLAKIAGASIDDSFLYTGFEPGRQLEFATGIVSQLGFDLNGGRIDLSAHPFCTSFSIGDVRLTTRVLRNELPSCLFGLIHEAGHGMYEQGFDPAFERTPLAEGISMGIHESQSLFWENMVGRSEEFWQWAFPQLREAFPEQMSGVTPERFWRGINRMKPSLIRVEADELTYNLHIILRLEIEEALINGRMEVADVPRVWNEKTEQYLGITPPDDARGCLQDVHWSFGGFGYFPCYTLGKLYAAMFHRQAVREIDGLGAQIARGEFQPLLGWLREKIHRWGKVRTAEELVREICGRPLTETDFLEYLEAKIERVYQGAVAR